MRNENDYGYLDHPFECKISGFLHGKLRRFVNGSVGFEFGVFTFITIFRIR